MKEELNNLLELSDLDKKAYNLRKSNKDLPIKINELKSDIEKAESSLSEINSLIEGSEKKIRENKAFTEDEMKALEASEERLKNISTNKEYDAAHSEIATHRRNIEDAQANTLHYEQVLENLKEDKKAIEENYNAIIKTNNPELEVLEKDLDSLETRISAEVEKSKEPRGKISRKLIGVYDRIKNRRKSPNIISVLNWESGVCTVCNRTQPPQKVNEVSKMDKIVTCETCGSILIWKEGGTSDDSETSGLLQWIPIGLHPQVQNH